jgi:transmembrane 9 superfamily member 2/4
MMNEEFCKILCQVNLKTKDVNDFKRVIKDQYHHNWIIDNLPAASILDNDQYSTTQYVGFPIGYVDGKNYYIYNHVNIILEYHTVEGEGSRIVGFYVEPLSVQHKFANDAKWDGKDETTPPQLATCKPNTNKHLSFDDVKSSPQKVQLGDILFTYDVQWRESEVKWASRWDVYKKNTINIELIIENQCTLSGTA